MTSEREHPPAQARTGMRRAGRIVSRRPLATALAVGAVVLVVLVVVAAFVVSGSDASEVLVEAPEQPDADLSVDVQITTIDPRSAELRVRLVVTPLDAARAPGGIVAQGFRIFVNDVRGQTTYTFEPGRPLQSIEVSTELTGGSVLQYPFDDYRSSVVVFAGEGVDPLGTVPLPIALSAEASLTDFDVSADVAQDGSEGVAGLALRIDRPVSTIGYAVWMMALMWGLAIAGLGVVWAIVRWEVELPWWSFGYLVGVLFALPPLRAALPGSPPPGGFVDYVAFYWVVAVIGVSLLIVLWTWIDDARRSRTVADTGGDPAPSD